jgi:hypothetical protein
MTIQPGVSEVATAKHGQSYSSLQVPLLAEPEGFMRSTSQQGAAIIKGVLIHVVSNAIMLGDLWARASILGRRASVMGI